MRKGPLRHITEDMKISISPTVPIGLMQKKVRQLLRKLGTVEHNKFVDYILPNKTCELGFLETVELLSELFSSKTSLFHKRRKCLNLTKRDRDDYLGFASVLNKNCDDSHNFAQIREFGFKVKEAKCDFCMNKIKYLGHIIDKDGIPKGLQVSRICPPLIMLRYCRASLDLQTTTKVS